MKTQWKKIWLKGALWLVTEIILNLFGLDNLADYSEFIFEQEVMIATHQSQMTVVAASHNPRFDYSLPCRFTIALTV
ncbi:MAG TPA: hypothetical protein V6D14_18030 [Coleofasciculaceae cyanobacterium]|jgi:hypothetical protein